MAETRRVELVSSTPLPTEKKKENKVMTVRLNISLTESTEATCPEFSYIELLLKNGPNEPDAVLDPNDPFAAKDKAEHDKLLAIGRSFETKYGTKPGKRKHLNGCRRSDVRDLVDLGDGYDETDQFIDNTEAYDEYVPKTLTTKFGGFYINVGVLDFREVSDHEDLESSSCNEPLIRKKKFKRHRVFSDSEDFVTDNKIMKKKHSQLKENGNGEQFIKKRKKLRFDASGEEKMKKRPPGRPPKFEKQHRIVSELISSSDNLVVSTAVNPEQDAVFKNPTCDVVPQQVEKKTLQETGSNPMPDTAARVSATNPATSSNVLPSSSSESLDSSTHKVNEPNGKSDVEPLLPDSLPPKLQSAMDSIKVAAKQTTEGRLFSTEINQFLLEIETECRYIPNSIKSAVFYHLAKALRCDKEFLIKRSKKLMLSHFDERLKPPTALLREAVQKVMPSIIERHRAEVSAIEQLRRERINESGKDPLRRDGGTASDQLRRDGGTASDSDENGFDENAEVSTPTTNGERLKRIMAPRKKFEWTQPFRLHLNNIVTIKMEQYEVSKIRLQTAEDYLKAFFEAELKFLWPAGWMQARMLFKESREAHFKWTSLQPKPKKMMLATGPVSKVLTAAEPEDRDNYISGSPVVKSEIKLAITTCEAGDTQLHHDVVSSSNDINLLRVTKPEFLKDSKLNLSLEQSKKVSFCPKIHVVQLPSDSQSGDSHVDQLRAENGSLIVLDDSVELCRGSSKSDSHEACLSISPNEQLGYLITSPKPPVERYPSENVPHTPSETVNVKSTMHQPRNSSIETEFCCSNGTLASKVKSEYYPKDLTSPVQSGMLSEQTAVRAVNRPVIDGKVKSEYYPKDLTSPVQSGMLSEQTAVRAVNKPVMDGKVKSEYYPKELTSPVQSGLLSEQPAVRAVNKPVMDLSELSPLDIWSHSKGLQVKSTQPSTSTATASPFSCSGSIPLSSPMKSPSRPRAMVPSVRPNADEVDSCLDLAMGIFSSLSNVTSPPCNNYQIRSSCSRTSTPSFSSQGHQQTSANPSPTSGRGDSQNQPWSPWPEWSPRLDVTPRLNVTSRELLVQSLMNDSIEQRRKMGNVSKLQAMPDSSSISATTTGDGHKSIVKAAVAQPPLGSPMALHSRPIEHKQSASPNRSTVSPQHRSLLLSSQQTSPLYHLPQGQSRFQSHPAAPSRSTGVRDVSGQLSQRQASMAVTAVLSACSNIYGPTSAKLSHQTSTEMDFASSSSARYASGLSSLTMNGTFRPSAPYMMQPDVPHTSPR